MRITLSSLLLAVLFQLSTTLDAQNYSPFIKHFGPKEYGREQPPENYCILQDHRGVIYSGNAGGILTFNGQQWNFIPVKSGQFVSSMAISPDGIVFCAGFNEMGFLEPQTNGSLKYVSLLDKLPENEQTVGQILRVHAIGNTVYFQSEAAVYEWNGKSMQVIRSKSSFHLSFTSDNRLFLRERETGLVELKDQKIITLASDTIFSNYGIFGVLMISKNEFLVVTQEMGLWVYSPNAGIRPFDEKTANSVFPHYYGGTMTKNGMFALNTLDEGISVFRMNGEFLYRIDKTSGLPVNEIQQVYCDRQNNLWAVSSAGVSFIETNSPFEFYGPEHGLAGSVECVSYNSKWYVGTSEGLFKLNSGSNTFEKINEVPGHVYCLYTIPPDYAEGGSILTGSSTGLYLTSSFQTTKILNENVNSFLFLGNHVLVAGERGIGLINLNGILLHWEDIPITRALGITADKTGDLWIGTAQQGMIRVKPEYVQAPPHDPHSTQRNQVLQFKANSFQFDVYDDLDGLNKGFVRAANYKDDVVFLTTTGFQVFINEKEVAKSLPDSLKGNPDFERGYFDVLPLFDTLWKKPISAFCEFNNGAMHVACIDNKVVLFTKTGEKQEKIFRSLNLGRINLIEHTDHNSILIGGDDGIAIYNPEFIGYSMASSIPVIEEVKNKKGELLFAGFHSENGKWNSAQPETFEIQVPYSENTIEFQFAYPYFTGNHQPEFSWMLQGHDDEWNPWVKTSSIRFTNLHEGTYVLHLKARTVFGDESKVATFTFTVLPPWYRTNTAYIGYFILAIVLIWISIRIASYRLKQKNIHLEAVVKERTAEIANKNVVLEKQNIQISHQKEEITDSITYALRIQQAILPIRKEINKYFPESFILFKPKDIVSGDFYWFHHLKGKSLIVCADCTGHGVPGAFMSMICTDKLNHTVLEKDILSPGMILSEVNRGIKKSLKQAGEDNLNTRDGMDAALCLYDHDKKTLIYSGANRPLWLIRNGEITEYRPTKSAVGGFTTEDQQFEEITIQILPGDRIYMSTDGYADQFGGEKGKKMMVRSFKDFILKIVEEKMEIQERRLDEHFEAWKNFTMRNGEHYEQVDDVCVIAIQF